MTYDKLKKEELKEKCISYIGKKKCHNPNCGIDYFPACCYDFHHFKGLKEFEISNYKNFDEKMKKELDKCIILCKICHTLLHNKLIKKEDLIWRF